MKTIQSTNHKDDLKFLRLFSDRNEISKGFNRDKTIKTTVIRYYFKENQIGQVIKRNSKIEDIFIYDN
jgi:hypothetical protein